MINYLLPAASCNLRLTVPKGEICFSLFILRGQGIRLFTSHGLGVYHRILYYTHSPEPKSVIKDIHPRISWHNLYLPCLMILGELLWQ